MNHTGFWHTESLASLTLTAVALLGAALLTVRAVAGRPTGRWVTFAVPRRVAVPAAAIGLLVLEINQQAHAELLTTPWTG
ncbi:MULTISPECIES: hypothetical protein [Nocardia]|uniref:hypothetical protein n=1 Tax=Nocardia TaxID=1817 RepID=UPI0002F1BAEC|nr:MULTISPECIES: hypothetical protein [Nocardia]